MGFPRGRAKEWGRGGGGGGRQRGRRRYLVKRAEELLAEHGAGPPQLDTDDFIELGGGHAVLGDALVGGKQPLYLLVVKVGSIVRQQVLGGGRDTGARGTTPKYIDSSARHDKGFPVTEAPVVRHPSAGRAPPQFPTGRLTLALSSGVFFMVLNILTIDAATVLWTAARAAACEQKGCGSQRRP